MQSVQKTFTQYGLRSQVNWPMHDKTEESMAVASQTSEPQVGAIAELASIKTLLQGIASDMTGLKSGMDAVQATVEKLGTQMTEAEACISALEDRGQVAGVTVDGAVKTIKRSYTRKKYIWRIFWCISRGPELGRQCYGRPEKRSEWSGEKTAVFFLGFVTGHYEAQEV